MTAVKVPDAQLERSSRSKRVRKTVCSQCGEAMRIQFVDGKRSWRCANADSDVDACSGTLRIPVNERLPTRTVAIDMAKALLADNGNERRKNQKQSSKQVSRLASGLRRVVAEQPYLSSPERSSLTDGAQILERLVTASEMAKQESKRLMPASDHSEVGDSLGARLRVRRKALSWTQTYLAERVGTSQAVIQKIENGKSLRPRLLSEIAAALGVRPSWLQFGAQEPDSLSDEALQVGLAWSRMTEPHRTAMRNAIVRMIESGEQPSDKTSE